MHFLQYRFGFAAGLHNLKNSISCGHFPARVFRKKEKGPELDLLHFSNAPRSIMASILIGKPIKN